MLKSCTLPSRSKIQSNATKLVNKDVFANAIDRAKNKITKTQQCV